MLGMRWSTIYVRPLSVVRQNCYLSIDNYNFNEFLVIELEGIERTITKTEVNLFYVRSTNATTDQVVFITKQNLIFTIKK